MIGILVEISYKGKKFDAFDEIKDKKTVKGVFKKYLEEKNIKYSPIQQAGRTDAFVSANSNYLYFKTDSLENIKNMELNKDINGLKILKINKFLNNIELPNIIERRIYIYHMPQKLVFTKKEDIIKKCLELSGKKDFSKFTDFKGLKLKNHIRDIEISFINGKLIFNGDSFMPKQVRIMTNYILNDSLKPAPPKYLRLEKVIIKNEYLKHIENIL